MREIRFRFWDKEGAVMLDWLTVRQTAFNRDDLHLMYDVMGTDPNIIKMQFTGLLDKNGTDIYESDIIELPLETGERINVICRFGTVQRKMDTGWLVDITGFYFQRSDGLNSFPIANNYAGKHDLELFEVIGDIHSNPELLK